MLVGVDGSMLEREERALFLLSSFMILLMYIGTSYFTTIEIVASGKIFCD